jgi:hypothetical protein
MNYKSKEALVKAEKELYNKTVELIKNSKSREEEIYHKKNLWSIEEEFFVV